MCNCTHHLFICVSFDNVFNSSYYIASNDGGLLVHNKLEKMWKEADMAYFEILYWHLLGGTDNNHDKFQSQ